MEEEEEVMVLVNGKEIALDAVTEEHQEQMSKEVSLSLPPPHPPRSLSISPFFPPRPPSLPPPLPFSLLSGPHAVHAGSDPF